MERIMLRKFTNPLLVHAYHKYMTQHKFKLGFKFELMSKFNEVETQIV